MYNIYCDNINTLGYERKQNAYIVLLFKGEDFLFASLDNEALSKFDKSLCHLCGNAGSMSCFC